MNTNIRLFAPTDKQACLQAFKSNIPKYFATHELADFEHFLDGLIAGSITDANYYVIEYNNEVVGCGGFGIKTNEDYYTLIWGMVHNSFHKLGLGKLLLKYRVEAFKKLFPNNHLHLDTTQHTYSFFEKYGFVTTKITNDFYTAGMHRYDMVST